MPSDGTVEKRRYKNERKHYPKMGRPECLPF